MRFDPPTPVPQRPSGSDRDAVIRRLEESCAQERLSLDVFAARVDDAYSASTRGQLDEPVGDLELSFGDASCRLAALLQQDRGIGAPRP